MQDNKYSDIYKAALPHIENFRELSSEKKLVTFNCVLMRYTEN